MKYALLAAALLLAPSPSRAADLLIPQETLQALITYLAAKPYQEVYQIIPALQNLRPADPPKPPPVPEEKK